MCDTNCLYDHWLWVNQEHRSDASLQALVDALMDGQVWYVRPWLDCLKLNEAQLKEQEDHFDLQLTYHLEKEATERHLLMSLTFVVFLEGCVTCFKCAWVLSKSGHSDCMSNQADLVVKGNRFWLSMIFWHELTEFQSLRVGYRSDSLVLYILAHSCLQSKMGH